MEKLKGILKKIFCLPPLPTVLIAVPAFIFVFVILGLGGHPLLAYISYGLSAYALIITVTGISGIYKGIQKGIRENPLMKKLRGIPIVRRYLDDGAFRAEISLYTGVTINFAYVFIKLFSGIYYRSLWFVALAFYYVFLAITRFMLLHDDFFRNQCCKIPQIQQPCPLCRKSGEFDSGTGIHAFIGNGDDFTVWRSGGSHVSAYYDGGYWICYLRICSRHGCFYDYKSNKENKKLCNLIFQKHNFIILKMNHMYDDNTKIYYGG